MKLCLQKNPGLIVKTIEQNFFHLESIIAEQDRVVNPEFKSIKEQHSLIINKQNSNLTVLLILLSAVILSTVILHFL